MKTALARPLNRGLTGHPTQSPRRGGVSGLHQDLDAASRPIAYARHGEHRRRWLRELRELLAFPTVSAQQRHHPDLAAAANWLKHHLAQIGLRGARVLEGAPGSMPSVYAEWLDAPGRPTLLLYGHYDVQPTGALEAWQSPPFSGTRHGDHLIARGASDDKGQLFIQLKALESWLRSHGRLPLNVKVWLEGEEEIGSPTIHSFLEREAARLGADAMLVSDTEMAGADQPAIVTGLRGLLVCELELHSATGELHDGRYGGAAPNPLHALTTMLATLHDRCGQVTLRGFYNRVAELPPLSGWADGPGRPPAVRLRGARFSSSPCERTRFTPLERTTSRPAITLTGLRSGSVGPMARSAIPHRAVARLSIRLVPDQQPAEIAALLRGYLADATPPDLRSRLRVLGRADPVLVPHQHPALLAAVRAVQAVWGVPPIMRRSGGSIPAVAALQRRLGIVPVLLGFGLPNDHAHGPNEQLGVRAFFRGVETLVRFYGEYAKT